MKNVYMTPEFQILSISSKDVIATSGNPISDLGNGDIGIDASYIF